jgi:hypothetical protein
MPKFEVLPYVPGKPCPAGFKVHTYRATRRRPEVTVCLRKRDLKAEKAAEVAKFNELANLFGKTSFGRNSPPARSRSRSRSRNRNRGNTRRNRNRNNRSRSPTRNNRNNHTSRHYVAPKNNYRGSPVPVAANVVPIVVDAENLDDALFGIMKKMKL